MNGFLEIVSTQERLKRAWASPFICNMVQFEQIFENSFPVLKFWKSKILIILKTSSEIGEWVNRGCE